VTTIHTIGIAGIRVAAAPDRVRTVLGSCIGIALYDRAAKVGGMAHVILPCSQEGSGERGKFADTAVDDLLTQLLAAGGIRGRVQAKIAGGASMFGKPVENGLGDRNAKAVRDRLEHHAIPLVAEDCGGQKGRKITLDPTGGEVEVQIIGQPARVI
jgi:chemotaxis protein CheD